MRHRNKWITLGIVRPNAPFRDVVGAHNQPVDLPVHAVIGRRGVRHQTDAITFCNAEPIDIITIHEQHHSRAEYDTKTVAIGVDGRVELPLAAESRELKHVAAFCVYVMQFNAAICLSKLTLVRF